MNFFIFLFAWASLFASHDWIARQISQDLAPFRNIRLCDNCIVEFQSQNVAYFLCVFEIKSNQVFYKTNRNLLGHERVVVIRDALVKLCQKYRMPDVTFLVTVHDAVDFNEMVPIFGMSKRIGGLGILFPDFEAFRGAYQVIDGINLELRDFPIAWENRKDLLIWRGAGSQGEINSNNMNQKSRVTLCKYSAEYPNMVDAGFSFCIPDCLRGYVKNSISYPEIFSHRYQIWMDGNASSYSNSGWRLYTGSTVLKPDSPFMQWYYGDLLPWIHYVPVKENLEDLIDTLCMLKNNEDLSAKIAANGLKFAREHINEEMNFLYMHDLIWKYATSHIARVCSNCNKPLHRK